MRKSTKSSKAGKIVWKLAPDVKKRVVSLLGTCDITWVRPTKIFCFRSLNAKTRACARIWGLNRIWQMALKEEAAYIIEAISEKFDRLPDFEKDKVLLHELTHIPRNFSGALMPHVRRGKHSFNDKVRRVIALYLAKQKP